MKTTKEMKTTKVEKKANAERATAELNKGFKVTHVIRWCAAKGLDASATRNAMDKLGLTAVILAHGIKDEKVTMVKITISRYVLF